MHVILQDVNAMCSPRYHDALGRGAGGPSQVSGEARTSRLDPGNTPVSNS